MTKNTPIDYNAFHSIIANSIAEADFLEELYKLDISDIPNKINSYHDVLTLLSLLFKDYYEILLIWIYDNDYGRDIRTNIIYHCKPIQSISDIYELLLKIYNDEVDINDVMIFPKEGDDLLQTEECFQKE